MRVDGVAGEAAAELVVDAPGGHGVERARHHLELAAAQQQLDASEAGGNLGAEPKPPQRASKRCPQRANSLAEDRLGQRVGGRPRRALACRIARDQLGAPCSDDRSRRSR